MSSHFLLSAKAVDISVTEVARWSETKAAMFLAEARWGSVKAQVCPWCNTRDAHWPHKQKQSRAKGGPPKPRKRTHLQWRCKQCRKAFSVTTGTPFHGHKRPLTDYVLAMLLFVNSVGGQAALQLRRHLKLSYNAAYVLAAKVREVLVNTNNHGALTGEIEVDGGHYCGKKRPPNFRGKRNPDDAMSTIPNRLLTREAIKARERAGSSREERPRMFHKNRRIVINMRQRSEIKGKGAVRTIVAVCDWEQAPTMQQLAAVYLDPKATIITDEGPGFSNFSALFDRHDVINHTEAYSNEDGVNQNQAESFFSRGDRAVYGVLHRAGPKYLHDYACEWAWREDVRRMSNGEQLRDILGMVMKAGRSANWTNFSHGHHRDCELMFPRERYFPPSGPPPGYRATPPSAHRPKAAD